MEGILLTLWHKKQMGSNKLDLFGSIPSKRSSQILMGSNWELITKKGVSTYRFGVNEKEKVSHC